MCDQSMMPMGTEVDASFEFGGGNPTARRSTHPGCELRAGRMYMYCDCNRRNGLQDNCPRTVCHDNSNQMQAPGFQGFSPNDGFSTSSNGLRSKNAPASPFGAPMSGYQEYYGDGIPAGLAIHPYSSTQQSGGMPDGSSWTGSGQQTYQMRPEGLGRPAGPFQGHMGYGDMGLQRW